MKRRGELTGISALLATYETRIKPPQGSVQIIVAEVITEVTGRKIEKSQVEYTVATKTITLRLPSVLKQEIMLQHEEIMAHIRGRMRDQEAIILA